MQDLAGTRRKGAPVKDRGATRPGNAALEVEESMGKSKWFRRAALSVALAALTTPALAADLSMWVRASGANAAQHLVDLWNSGHADKINLTVIPDNQMVSKLATGVKAGEVPDVISFDLIYMPDFMRAGFLNDITDAMKADPNFAKIAPAYVNLATYKDRLYGAGFTPDVSILVYNKDLFRKAGLDPDKPPKALDEIHQAAKKIRTLGPDIYGFYFSGACPGCNIFHDLADDGRLRREDSAAQRRRRAAGRPGRQGSAAALPRHVDRRADPEKRAGR